MTTHRSPQGPGGGFDETPGDHPGDRSNEDLSPREETIEATAPAAPERDGDAALAGGRERQGGGAPATRPEQMTDDELEAHVLSTVGHMNALEACLAMAVAELDRRGVAERTHVLSTKQWLRHACRMSAARASTVLRIGRSLDAMPVTAGLAQAGEITPDGLRMLSAAHVDHPDEFATHEPVLADVATYLGPRDLRRAIAHWRQQVDHPGAIAAIDDAKRRRRLSCTQTWDGMWSISGMLDPESGHVVSTAIRSHIGSAALDSDDDRTPGQRSADALVDVCRFSLDHDDTLETSGGTKPHITATVDVRTLIDTGPGSGRETSADVQTPSGPPGAPLPEIDGMPISPEDARRLACDAGITRIITNGPSHVLDVGRTTRTIPPATRRAVEHRDGGCAWPGCDRPIAWCDVHHVVHWADGGPTDLANLTLLCRRHHTATHEGRSPPG